MNGVLFLLLHFQLGLWEGGSGTGAGLALQLAPRQRSGIELLARDCTVDTTKVLLTLVTPF